MNAVITVIAIALFLGGVYWAQYRLTHGRIWSPLWMAFSFTFSGALIFLAGAGGYRLSRRARFIDGTNWTDGVVWSQITIGGVLLAIAAVCWVIALRSLGLQRPSRCSSPATR